MTKRRVGRSRAAAPRYIASRPHAENGPIMRVDAVPRDVCSDSCRILVGFLQQLVCYPTYSGKTSAKLRKLFAACSRDIADIDFNPHRIFIFPCRMLSCIVDIDFIFTGFY
jgi:hypothetical protein